MSSTDHVRSHALTRAPRMRNTLEVLNVIGQRSAVTQHELATTTKLSRGTVAAVVRHLRARNLIELAEPAQNGLNGLSGDGRPPTPIRLRPDAAPAMCIDLGSRHVAVGIGGLKGLIGEPRTRKLSRDVGATDALEIAISLVGEVLEDHPTSISPSDLVGVCVAVAAPLDQTRGQVASGCGINSWIGLRPADELQYRLGYLWSDVPFILENNANLDALVEFERGAAKPRASDSPCQDVVILVRWGNGIGGAVLVDGRLVVGARGVATELGHTPIHRQRDGVSPCPKCGHICVDSLASGDALTSQFYGMSRETVTFDKLIERAVASQGAERDLLTQAAKHIGEVLGGYVSFLNARLVVVSGHHFGDAPHDVKAYTLIADAIRTGMRDIAFPPALEDVDIVLGQYSRFATVEGGVIAVLHTQLTSFFESRITRLAMTS